MARFTEASKQAVLDKLDALAVAGDYLRLEKKGGRYWGLCPFHHEKTPSFTVDPDRKFYYCFGCHKGGSIVDFIMEMDKLSFPEAIETLARRFGVELAYEAGGIPDDGKKEALEELAELYRRVTMSFHHLLLEKPEGKRAKDYILGRGIGAETISAFRLGYSPADRSWLFRFIREKGFSAKFLAGSGLFSSKQPGAAFFWDRLMFPINDKRGRTVAFGGRLLSGEGPKYINSAESGLFKKGQNLFALDRALAEIRNSKTAVLAEGYMDVLALHQAGITNAVAPLGTAFTDDQARLLKRWADKLVLMLDADEAGQNAAIKAVISARKNGLDCFVAVVPTECGNAKDPAEILQKYGGEALKNIVNNSIFDFDYLISRSRAVTEDASRAAAFLFPYLAALDSEVSRDSCMGLLADVYGVDRHAVRDDFRRFTAGEESRPLKGTPDASENKAEGDPPRMNGELYLLTAVFLNPGFYRELRAKISVDDLEDPSARELFIVLEECFRNNGTLSSAAVYGELVSSIGNGGLKDFIMRQGSSGAFARPEKIVRDGIVHIWGKSLKRRRSKIVLELRAPGINAGRQGDLLAEKVHIDSELTTLMVLEKETDE